jgi:hypothetical protein
MIHLSHISNHFQTYLKDNLMPKKKNNVIPFNELTLEEMALQYWQEMDDRTGDLYDETTVISEEVDQLLTQQTVTVDRLNAIVAVMTIIKAENEDLWSRVDALEHRVRTAQGW